MSWQSILISRSCIPPRSSSSTGNTSGWWTRTIIVMLPATNSSLTATTESFRPCSWSPLTRPARFPFVQNRYSRLSRSTFYDMMKQNHLLASVILRNALSELCSRYNERKRANMLAWLAITKRAQKKTGRVSASSH